MFSVSHSVPLNRFLVGISFLLLSLSGLSTPSHAQGWDLADDFSGTSNPNGAWTYGQYISGTFSALPQEQFDSTWQGPSWISGGDGIIKMNGGSSVYNGVGPGQVSLDADNATPVARWTAPATGIFDISVAIGGFGTPLDADAHQSGLNINGVAQTGSYDGNSNVYTWLIHDIGLSKGTTVDAYVNHDYGYGNTQTAFTVIQQAAITAPQLTRQGNVITVTFTVTNVSNDPANATITAATLNGVSTTTRPLPGGTIPSGVTINVAFTFPGTVGSHGQVVTLKFNGIYGTGNYTYSLPVTLP
jgi:hypothetical protein